MKKTTIAISLEAKNFLDEEKRRRGIETFDEVILSIYEEIQEKKNQLADRVMDQLRAKKPSQKVNIPDFDLKKLEDEYYGEQF